MTLANFNSFDVKLKDTLQAYLSSLTGITFESPEIYQETVSGWININRIEYNKPKRIFNPFPLPTRAEYNIEIRLNLREIDIELLDNALLRASEFVKGALELLQLNGTTISHPNYLAPTIFKGIQILNYTRNIEAQSTGNQELSDKVYFGQAIINCTYKL
jgi:hypothetical protein